MAVTPQEVYEMAKLKAILNGTAIPDPPYGFNEQSSGRRDNAGVELLGPGQVGNREISAVADFLKKLNNLTEDVAEDLVTAARYNEEIKTAINTSVNKDGVKIGMYQIEICEDQSRIAGRQYYNIKHTRSGDVLAEQVTLYETALNVVKLLNSGYYINDIKIAKLFEYDNSYAGHKIDAVGYKKKSNLCEKQGQYEKKSMFEARYQASTQRAMDAKINIKNIIKTI